jgi:hypothetical protein
MKMIWMIFAAQLVLWARGKPTSFALSGLIENLVGHPAGRGVFTHHSGTLAPDLSCLSSQGAVRCVY